MKKTQSGQVEDLSSLAAKLIWPGTGVSYGGRPQVSSEEIPAYLEGKTVGSAREEFERRAALDSDLLDALADSALAPACSQTECSHAVRQAWKAFRMVQPIPGIGLALSGASNEDGLLQVKSMEGFQLEELDQAGAGVRNYLRLLGTMFFPRIPLGFSYTERGMCGRLQIVPEENGLCTLIVTLSQNGQPAEGAGVELFRDGIFVANDRADAQGAKRFQLRPGFCYELQAGTALPRLGIAVEPVPLTASLAVQAALAVSTMGFFEQASRLLTSAARDLKETLAGQVGNFVACAQILFSGGAFPLAGPEPVRSSFVRVLPICRKMLNTAHAQLGPERKALEPVDDLLQRCDFARLRPLVENPGPDLRNLPCWDLVAGAALGVMGQYQPALARVEKAELAPALKDSAVGWFQLLDSRPAVAAKAFERALAADPDQIDARHGLHLAKIMAGVDPGQYQSLAFQLLPEAATAVLDEIKGQ